MLGNERNGDFEWAQENQLSVILEILESEAGTRKNTPNWSEKIETTGEFLWEKTIPFEIQTKEVWIGNGKGKNVAKSTNRPLERLPRSEKRSIDWSKGYKDVFRDEKKGRPWERPRRPSWSKVRFEQRIIE